MHAQVSNAEHNSIHTVSTSTETDGTQLTAEYGYAMRVDVHGHAYPPAYLDALACRGGLTTQAVQAAPGFSFSVDERLQLMDAAGIGHQILSVGPQFAYFPERSFAIEATQLGNDLLAELCMQHPDRLAAFGSVPLPHVDAAMDEASRCLDRLGMLGITVGCSIAGLPLDDPGLIPFFELLDQRAAVVALHAVGAGSGPRSDTWMLGTHFDLSTTVVRLMWNGFTVRYPSLRLIVPLLGGALPFLAGRLDNYAARTREALPFNERPGEHLRRFWYDTVFQTSAAIRCACDAFWMDKVLFGTDFPYQADPGLSASMSAVEGCDISDDVKERIWAGNAQALLHLQP
jgi:6-methylsalicylate decarboxylase